MEASFAAGLKCIRYNPLSYGLVFSLIRDCQTRGQRVYVVMFVAVVDRRISVKSHAEHELSAPVASDKCFSQD